MTARELRIGPAVAKDLPFVLSLLEECGLPVAGVREHFDRFFVARAGRRRIGCVGMELYGEDVLLRSLAVARHARDAGAGGALLSRAISEARRAGGRTAWGLTTIGRKGLFDRLGFRVVPRCGAPPGLARSTQFRGVCPESAVLIALAL
ncbi:MAG: GNAT family N-acetyltransferase [Gemmatimonadota bacterium]